MAGSMPFKEMKEISSETIKVLDDLGYTTATPVQQACIPLFAGNKDVAVDACTGSGKTLAFVVPLIEKLRRLEEPLRKNQVGAIVISPTRELAQQIFQVAQPFVATLFWLKAILLVGGTNPTIDVAAFENSGGNVMVGTPGRIADVFRRSSQVDPRQLELLVLDEADRLLDLGFKEQLDFIFGRLPRQRRTGLFSATQTEAVQELARAGLRNPVRVKVAIRLSGTAQTASQRTPLGLSISYRVCESTSKLSHLVNFLEEHKKQKVIVYSLTCACVELLTTVLKRLPRAKGLSVKALHGRMKQNQRHSALDAFSSQQAGCLLCTDVAARGLDIPDVDWIVQLDPPQSPDAFVHRVGRTARMGRIGHALVFLMPHEIAYIEFLRLRKVPLQESPDSESSVPDLMPALRELAESDRDVLEKGIKAFVSYVRGYKEHQCKYIFRIADLDLGKLAYACALLQLPRMPEIRKLGGKVDSFASSAVNPNEVKFKDKARQKGREKLLAEKAKRKAEEPAKEAAKRNPEPEKRLTAVKRRLLEQRQDESELAEDYRLLKRLRRGKMTNREYDIATGLVEEETVPAAKEGAAEEKPAAVQSAKAKRPRPSRAHLQTVEESLLRRAKKKKKKLKSQLPA